jgi:LmbE family N-acetylglucosaminyl deacetylase
VIPNTKLPRDDEGYRLFALYEASSAKEIAATYQLLYPGRSLPHETYMEMVSDLRAIRAECNDNMLAVGKHRQKMRERLSIDDAQ